ncbi:hypothetical protein MGN70_011730 [Eutypa lata]|nr:hypothetical protein MGN70_011730 [Eutypa lata]
MLAAGLRKTTSNEVRQQKEAEAERARLEAERAGQRNRQHHRAKKSNAKDKKTPDLKEQDRQKKGNN